MLVDARTDVVVFNAADAEAIACRFTLPGSCSDVAAGIFIDALLISVIIGVGFCVLVDVKTNVLIRVMTALKSNC